MKKHMPFKIGYYDANSNRIIIEKQTDWPIFSEKSQKNRANSLFISCQYWTNFT
jgi:hypothetical protein